MANMLEQPHCEMEQPYCERCGEDHATIQTLECALCDDCFADEAREALEPLLGKRCGQPVWQREDGMPAICIAPYGIEHAHG